MALDWGSYSVERVADFYSLRADYPLRSLRADEKVVVGSDVRYSKAERPQRVPQTAALWMAVFDDRCLVSTRHELVYEVERTVQAVEVPAELMDPPIQTRLLELCLAALPGTLTTYSGVKRLCDGRDYQRINDPNVRKLTSADLPLIMDRFYPDVPGDDPDYAEEILGGDAAFAYYVGDEPVSLAHTHHPGPMCDHIGDLSVEGTLESHRRRGYGKAVVSATTGEVLRQGRVPVWGAFDEDVAVRRTASSVGFQIFCRVFEVRYR